MLTLFKKETLLLHWQTGVFLFIYAGIRFASYFLQGHEIAQAFFVFALLFGFAVLYFQNKHLAFLVLIGELLLGGAGHFLEAFGLSLRTCIFLTFIFLWGIHGLSRRDLRYHFRVNHTVFYLILALFVYLGFSAGVGVYQGHEVRAIVQDLIPFAFFLLFLPLYHFLQEKKYYDVVLRLIVAWILGTALFSLLTFALFSGGVEVLHDPFYKWFRDVAMGKITDVGNGFFRIVLPEQLLLVPIILILAWGWMKEKLDYRFYVLMTGLMLAFVLNFSRGYMLGLAIGFFVLMWKNDWKRWLRMAGVSAGIFLILFVGISSVASGFETSGLPMLIGRGASIVNPESELSSYTRLTLLDPIVTLWKTSPVIGVGPGASILVYSSELQRFVETRQFDWGYLELLTEFGMVGLLLYLAIPVYGVLLLRKDEVHVGAIAGLVGLAVVNVTAPALFHVFGVVYIVFLLGVGARPKSLFHRAEEIFHS